MNELNVRVMIGIRVVVRVGTVVMVEARVRVTVSLRGTVLVGPLGVEGSFSNTELPQPAAST